MFVCIKYKPYFYEIIIKVDMKNQICKNCKHWKVTKSFPVEGDNIGKCKMVKMFWDCTEWVNKGDNYVRQLKKENKNDKAFVQDESDYRAYLITKEEFGCNQFSEQQKCKCKGGAVGRTVTADFEHQICDRCGNIAS